VGVQRIRTGVDWLHSARLRQVRIAPAGGSFAAVSFSGSGPTQKRGLGRTSACDLPTRPRTAGGGGEELEVQKQAFIALVSLAATISLVACGGGVGEHIAAGRLRDAERYCATELVLGSLDQQHCLERVGKAYEANAEELLRDGKPCQANVAYAEALEFTPFESEWQFELLVESIPAIRACAESKRDGDLFMSCAERAHNLATAIDADEVLSAEERRAHLDVALDCVTQARKVLQGCRPGCAKQWAKAEDLRAEIRETL